MFDELLTGAFNGPPGYDSNNPITQMSRSMAIGLLAGGHPIRAGRYVLTEPWMVNHVPVEVVLRSAITGLTLCGPGSQPEPVPESEAPAFVPEPPAEPAFVPPVAASPRAVAEAFLRHTLGGGKTVTATRVQGLAVSAGISVKTLRRAQKALGVKTVQQGGSWQWYLPVAVATWPGG